MEDFNNFIEHSNKTEWGGSVYIMERNGDAYVRLYYYNDDIYTVYIEGLSVSEHARRKGLATKLLKLCELVGIDMKATVCCLSVKKDSWMYAWYSRNGYCFVGTNDDQDDEVWMKKM